MFCTKTEILRGLDPHNPASIQALIDFHRTAFGGFTMTVPPPPPVVPGTPPPPDPPPVVPDPGTDGDKPLGPNGEKALQAERDARKAIETELKEFKTAQADQAKRLAEALGIETKDAKSSEEVVTALQQQVQDMQRDNLVYRVVTDPAHPITDADDLELIKAAPDEATMRKLATRLAKNAGTTGNGQVGKNGVGRLGFDPSQGRGSDPQGKPGDSGRAEAARRFKKQGQQQ